MSSFIHPDRKTDLLRVSIGVVYLWFGGLKFFAGLSPAESLATETLARLSFGLIPGHICYLSLAFGETFIGVLLVVNRMVRVAVMAAIVHMLGTFTPILLLPQVCFNEPPFAITLVGQYIVKNIVIVSALLVIYPFEPSHPGKKTNIKKP